MNLTFTQAELNIIAEALGNLPYIKVAAVIQSIQSQIDRAKEPKEPKDV